MKGLKIFSVLAVAALLLAPATMHARGPRVSFSFNFFEVFAPPPPPPPVAVPVYVPPPPPPPVFVERQTVYVDRQPIYVQRERVVRERHMGGHCPDYYVEEIKPNNYPSFNP